MFSRSPTFWLVCVLYGSIILLCPSEAPASVWFVTQAGSGDRSGSDWDNACGEAQFPAKIQNAATNDEIWVAKGVYRPSTSGNTSAHFTLKTGVALYGGFGGAETDRNERNVIGNQTILTGDLANDDEGKVDGVTVSADRIRGSNSRCVVVGSGVDGSAILDGFTITAGNNLADGAPAHGGGMYVLNGSPKVRNCTFAGNFAAGKGGGIFNNTANPTLTDCTFLGNRSQDGGGGIGNEGSGNFTISACTFSGNYAGSGGGIYNSESTPNVINCAFSGNTAIYFGGAIYNEGSSPIVMNCTFSENAAPAYPLGNGGGGMYNHGDGFFSFSNPVVTNCVFWNDSDGEIVDNGGTPTVNYCVVRGWYSGGGAHHRRRSVSRPVFPERRSDGNIPTASGKLRDRRGNRSRSASDGPERRHAPAEFLRRHRCVRIVVEENPDGFYQRRGNGKPRSRRGRFRNDGRLVDVR